MDAIEILLNETVANSRAALNKCDQLCEKTSTQCSCKTELETAQTEIKSLQTRCAAVEKSLQDHTEAVLEVLKTTEYLTDKINLLLDDDTKGSSSTTGGIGSEKIASTSKSTEPTLKKPSSYSRKVDINRTILTTQGETKANQQTEYSAHIDQDIVKQERQIVLDGEAYWRDLAQTELVESRTQFSDLGGVHTIICLDISESMVQKNGWQQATTFVTEYIQGLQEMSSTHGLADEYVALVTFGHETVVKQRYTNNYDKLQHVLTNLKPGGPSPLFGGMMMSLAAAWCSHNKVHFAGMGTQIWTRIILISDGRPTDSMIIAGPDKEGPIIEDTRNEILKELEHYRSENFDVFFVAVGNADSSFFEVMLGISDGIMLDHNSGRRLARRYFLSTQIMDTLGLLDFLDTPLHALGGADMSEEDKAEIRSIKERSKKHFSTHLESLRKDSQDHYHERQRTSLPSVGSRVRRGPDWKWKDQDSSGPGTVIGHEKNSDHVWVEWDTDGHTNVYGYGDTGYEVIIVDEPRKWFPAVGCVVKPGNKWKVSNQKQKSGVIIKLHEKEKTATVRWDNGHRGDYSYDSDNEEIVHSPPFEPFQSGGYKLGYTMEDNFLESSPVTTQTNKNKNKNIVQRNA